MGEPRSHSRAPIKLGIFKNYAKTYVFNVAYNTASHGPLLLNANATTVRIRDEIFQKYKKIYPEFCAYVISIEI